MTLDELAVDRISTHLEYGVDERATWVYCKEIERELDLDQETVELVMGALEERFDLERQERAEELRWRLPGRGLRWENSGYWSASSVVSVGALIPKRAKNLLPHEGELLAYAVSPRSSFCPITITCCSWLALMLAPLG